MGRQTVQLELVPGSRVARELSAGGAFVRDCDLAVNESCTLVIRASTEALTLEARVVYIDGNGGAGLELVGFGPELRAQLATLGAPVAVGSSPAVATPKDEAFELELPTAPRVDRAARGSGQPVRSKPAVSPPPVSPSAPLADVDLGLELRRTVREPDSRVRPSAQPVQSTDARFADVDIRFNAKPVDADAGRQPARAEPAVRRPEAAEPFGELTLPTRGAPTAPPRLREAEPPSSIPTEPRRTRDDKLHNLERSRTITPSRRTRERLQGVAEAARGEPIASPRLGDLDFDLVASDVRAPDLDSGLGASDLGASGLGASDFGAPDIEIGLGASDIRAPDLDIGFPADDREPDLEFNSEFALPDGELELASVRAPDILAGKPDDFDAPDRDVDLDAADLDLGLEELQLEIELGQADRASPAVSPTEGLPDEPFELGGDTEEERQIQRSMHERLRGLTTAEQIKKANSADPSERIMLERLYGKNVWEALLRNQRLTAPEVARIARMGTLPRPMLETIVGNGGWLQVPEVRRALLSNPRLGADQILRVLRLMPKHELKLAGTQTVYPMAVRDAAKKLARGAS